MTREEIIQAENLVYRKPELLNDVPMHYCPGCSHGVVHKLVSEVVAEMGMTEKTIAISPVGCAVFAYKYIDVDWQEAAHGRAPALASAVKRLWPDRLVFTYQGDGDLACIGTAETIHALNRGENITIIFINNAIYGMTGGQMAPTSLPNQVTQTSPYGRDVSKAGYPVRISELLATLDGVAYVERVTCDSRAHIIQAKKAIKKAFQNQIDGIGYSLVEVVATCPTNWGMTPQDAFQWLRDNMLPYYPLGVYKDVVADGYANAAEAALERAKDCPIAQQKKED